jgi:hypothetical protein
MNFFIVHLKTRIVVAFFLAVELFMREPLGIYLVYNFNNGSAVAM